MSSQAGQMPNWLGNARAEINRMNSSPASSWLACGTANETTEGISRTENSHRSCAPGRVSVATPLLDADESEHTDVDRMHSDLFLTTSQQPCVKDNVALT